MLLCLSEIDALLLGEVCVCMSFDPFKVLYNAAVNMRMLENPGTTMPYTRLLNTKVKHTEKKHQCLLCARCIIYSETKSSIILKGFFPVLFMCVGKYASCYQ